VDPETHTYADQRLSGRLQGELEMNELSAFIEAETLKRVIGVLAEIDERAVFTIEQDGLMCRVIDGGNAQLTTIRMPSEAFCRYTANQFQAGVDLNWMSKILDATGDDAIINMIIDKDEIHLNMGIQGLSRALLDLGELRKPPESPLVRWDVVMEVPGAFFKRMIKYLEAIDADGLKIHATSDNVIFYSHHNIGSESYYNSEVDCLTEYVDVAKAEYSINYLVDIAAVIYPHESVNLRFGTDLPIEIRYAVDGCEIEHILAPRIEDD